ncbi:hypothetical protein Shyhy02_14690 [Streptomyces hygroscopicus subsp. hygroscopicus]|nr:hypothetical protein Shyhy02_14690 [Streptomyces hygroscopicus subsp. hygroscopicus]
MAPVRVPGTPGGRRRHRAAATARAVTGSTGADPPGDRMKRKSRAAWWALDVLPLVIIYGIYVGIIGLAWAGKF